MIITDFKNLIVNEDFTFKKIIVGEALLISGLGTVVFVVVLLWHTHLGPGIAPSQTAANLLKKVGIDPTPGKKL